MKPLICALDIATTTGVAYGRADDSKPQVLTWDLRKGGKTRPYRLAYLGDQCFELFGRIRPDLFFYESGLTTQAALQIGTSDETFAFLRGAIGVAEAIAVKTKIPLIEAVRVQEARLHLLGRGRIPKGEGKNLVHERCLALGWPVTNLDESDACAIWSFGVGKTNPLAAHMTTPLFSGASR